MNSSEIAYGIHPVLEALREGKDIQRIFIQQGKNPSTLVELKELAKKNNIPLAIVPVEKLNRLTSKNHQGVVCLLSPLTYSNLEHVIPSLFEEGKIPFILIMDNITDVRNFGAIARTAECGGVHALLIPTTHTAPVNRDSLKSSSGALLKIPVCRTDNLKKSLLYLKSSGLQLVGATHEASDTLFDSKLKDPMALIMGSEDKGLSADVLRIADKLIRIPMKGEIASLNVSSAAAIFIFEIMRQREIEGMSHAD
ncbi:MAG: 23S rRNA (guanosine(2251)-2'-O)-methyltransferase RlmB [Bacteroidetes bacterium RIFCSPLOWO2_02_FULL_36_8]|nr:MAG: 23S rRNA (guanosine(2251)-2'-O)-methyltransferase RlmB [Bacteroidetes bacterium RIFCSPLOWO2_02_FULL_36_8]OFY71923.1 MAG: 23S rRNA (guanosine(2251)-2'-O)-methyltransferase RlmB [Bacteroidetes bacterium RIFCSPLOWO2_12_FULL_37_12]